MVKITDILLHLIFNILIPCWGLWLIYYGIKGGLIDKRIFDYYSKRYWVGGDAVIYGSLLIAAGILAFSFDLFLYMKHREFMLIIKR